MMTLKEIYVTEQLNIISEAIDLQKMQQMVQTISTLENVTAPVRSKLPALTAAINQAKDLATKKLSSEGGVWRKIATNINDKFKIVDDMRKFITFEACVLQGLRQLPTIITLLKKSDVDMANDADTLEKLFVKIPANRQQITQVFTTAFRPPAGIFMNRQIPFVNDPHALANDFFKLTPAEIEELANRSNELPAMPISKQDTKKLMTGSNPEAAQELASGQENVTGQDVTGKSTQVEPTTTTMKSDTATIAQASKKEIKMPDFMTAMKAIGAQDLDKPENRKTLATFKRFYNYIAKNAT
jgi:hypothetical protein